MTKRLGYKLIMLNNRDEWLDRLTSASAWANGYLAGRDERAAERGTWLGITHTGRIGNVLSITEPLAAHALLPNPPSRGGIPSNFCTSTLSPTAFCDSLRETAEEYAGFQFLALERNSDGLFECASLTNRLVDEIKTFSYPPGCYVIGNSPREAPMRKVVYGERQFRELIEKLSIESIAKNTAVAESEIVDCLLHLGRDDIEHHPDEQVAKQTGRDDTYNRPLSSIYVRFPPTIRYGTRCHTIVLVDRNDQVYWREERMTTVPDEPIDATWEIIEHRFELK